MEPSWLIVDHITGEIYVTGSGADNVDPAIIVSKDDKSKIIRVDLTKATYKPKKQRRK